MVKRMIRHSDATLMGITKKELVDYVRMAEHNYDVAREALHQQEENIKDWVPVVHCKDCKHFTEGMAIGMCKRIPDKPIIPMPHNAFCAFGERKKGNA